MKRNDHYPLRSKLRVFSILMLMMVFLAACTSTTPTPTFTPTAPATVTISIASDPTRTPTVRPSPTPTLPPLGTEGNPISMGFVLDPGETQSIDAIQEIAIFLAGETDFYIKYLIYPNFQSLSAAIIDGDVHFFWLNPLEYLYLQQAGAAEVVLMTNHLGVYAYGVQFLAHEQDGFRSYFNPQSNENSVASDEALQQFSGTRPCYHSSDSIPGYLVPQGLLNSASIPTLDPIFAYSYSAIIRALFIRGICDFGVSYALTGDPRSASDILQNLPEAQNQVQIVWRSNGIIPNTNLSASTTIPLVIQHRIQEALLDLPNFPGGLVLLSQALNYDVEALKTIDDGYYIPLRNALSPLEVDLETLIFAE